MVLMVENNYPILKKFPFLEISHSFQDIPLVKMNMYLHLLLKKRIRQFWKFDLLLKNDELIPRICCTSEEFDKLISRMIFFPVNSSLLKKTIATYFIRKILNSNPEMLAL